MDMVLIEGYNKSSSDYTITVVIALLIRKYYGIYKYKITIPTLINVKWLLPVHWNQSTTIARYEIPIGGQSLLFAMDMVQTINYRGYGTTTNHIYIGIRFKDNIMWGKIKKIGVLCTVKLIAPNEKDKYETEKKLMYQKLGIMTQQISNNVNKKIVKNTFRIVWKLELLYIK